MASTGKGTTDREKKPQLNERKKNKREQSPCAASSSADAAATGKSGVDCTDGEGVIGDSEVRKKRKKNKKIMQEPSSSTVSDDNAVEVNKSGVGCKHVEDVPGDDEASRRPRNEEDLGFSAANIAEQDVPKGKKKPKLGKRNKNKQEPSFPAVVDAAIVIGKSENESTDGKGVPGISEISKSPRNGEGQDCPKVNIVAKETLERKKPEPRKWKKNKQGRSRAAVSDDGAVEADKSGNVGTDGDDALGDAHVSMSTVEDPCCPEANMAEKGTQEKKKRKPKKRKNNKEGSPSVVLDTGAVVADEYGNSCMNGDGAPQDGEASISPRDGEDPNCPGVNIAEKGVPKLKKNKLKKWKKKNQEQSPSTLLDAGDVVPDKSGRGSTNVEAASRGADVTTSPRPGEGPECPNANITEHLVEENKVNEDYSQEPKLKKQKKCKQDQSPSVIPDTSGVVVDKIEKGYIEGEGGEGLPGDTEISMSPRNGKGPDCPEVNIAENSVEGKNENNGNSQKPKRKKRKRKKRAQVAVTEAPAVGDVSSDERKDVCRTGTVKVTGSMGYSICESEVTAKNVVQDMYSPGGSLVRVNVDDVVDILMKDLRRHLLFCWDASHCTTTKCSTLENQRKPLVLKELKKLWNKEDPDLPWEQGEFSPSNTLLVDDSPYKALCNPPHTAIFPQPYSYHNRTDNSLGPGGDLRVYLENLAAADDVQRYVQEHPFGQPFITESDPNWDFYAKIRDRLEKREKCAA
uniref:FCP1 homology domain-containing protein n=1 Tax=Aegilops tauschii TaxID=37682 RepID=M8BVY2_AEGTA